MTREECIGLLERYAEYHGMGIPNLVGCREAMKMAAELLSQPSLPSDIDEAAKKIVIQLHPSMEYSSVLGDRLTMGDLVELIKAGSEWMAGQGYVDTHAVINEYENWGDGFAKLGLGINEDDDFFEDWQEQNEIIVQIRKKQ